MLSLLIRYSQTNMKGQERSAFFKGTSQVRDRFMTMVPDWNGIPRHNTFPFPMKDEKNLSSLFLDSTSTPFEDFSLSGSG